MSEKGFSFSDVLDADETLLWSGRPNHAPATLVSGLREFADYAAWWIAALVIVAAVAAYGRTFFRQAQTGCIEQIMHCGPDRVFGWLLYLAAALILYIAIRMTLTSLRQRAETRSESYALTNERALLATQSQGQIIVRSIPIRPDQWISYTRGEGGEIGFSRMVGSEGDDDSIAYDQEMVFFRKIADADSVYRLVRQIQNGLK